MDRLHASWAEGASSVPHARGDGPCQAVTKSWTFGCSPRTWGWTESNRHHHPWPPVFPTHVGMDRGAPVVPRQLPRVPHARGDGPPGSSFSWIKAVCSPRTWGWTDGRHRDVEAENVFPTHVGMDRGRVDRRWDSGGVPHARGDGPREDRSGHGEGECSPRTWGWTGSRNHRERSGHVFPTHVGMDRSSSAGWTSSLRVPHARGDGPTNTESGTNLTTCSPRTWGWTAVRDNLLLREGVFPTHVGMDRERLLEEKEHDRVPHARGDGPAEWWA